MMRTGAALGLVLLAAMATPAFAQSFVGDWTATAHTPGGDISETLNVAKAGTGYTVTAKLVGAAEGQPEAGPGTDVVLDGDKFSYKRSVTTPNGAIEITYSGVVSGDKFTGKAEVGGQQVDYTGVRATPGK
jgi:hypothetical protein